MTATSLRWLLVVLALGTGLAAVGCGRKSVGPDLARGNPAPPPPVAAFPAPAPAARQRPVTLPPPTEHWLDDDAEQRNKQARKRWWAEMHRAAPGVDWMAIEHANGAALQDARNAAALAKGLSRGPWLERGSRNQAGRMHAAALNLAGDALFGGSARGGAWLGTLEGADWEPIGDNLYGGSHGLAVSASPTETLTSITDAGLVRFTVDGGVSWFPPAGLPGGLDRAVRIFTDPADAARVFLLTVRAGRRELHRSTDGGLSYALVRDAGNQAADFWMDRVAGGTLYLLAGVDLYTSANQGDNWALAGSLPLLTADGIVLTGSEAGAPTLYAAAHDPLANAWILFRSLDAGANWGSRGVPLTDFWEQLTASITDANLVVKGGVEAFRSRDGGQTFTRINRWADYYANPDIRLHADMQGIQSLMIGGAEAWLFSTDGGLYRSDDLTTSVRNLSLTGLGVSQYYSTHTSVNDPDLIVAGAQDQGYQRSFGTVGVGGQEFDQIISGDYANLTSADGTHEWLYSVYPGFVLIQLGEQAPVLEMADFPASENYPWLPFVMADPQGREAFFFCGRSIHRYTRTGMADDWVSTPFTAQAFNTAGASYLTVMASSPLAPDFRLAATNNGRIWLSFDGGVNWILSPDRGPSSFYLYGSALACSPLDVATAYIGGSGYSGPGVYRTQDGGLSWTPLAAGLPSTMVYDLAFEPGPSGAVYAATEAGAYRLDPLTDQWSFIGGTEAPLTGWFSVEAIAATGVMRFGTYGRGIWDYAIAWGLEADACTDGWDNDFDGLVDCLDSDCAAGPECVEDCTNGIDDNRDGAFDCADAQCVGDPLCPERDNCADGVDNDTDGATDCADTDCSDSADCPEDCLNGVDDDVDGDVDCADSECLTSDVDSDGVVDCNDCAPLDSGVLGLPPEVQRLFVAKAGGTDPDLLLLSWSAEGATAGTATAHDLFVGRLEDLHADRGFAQAGCLTDDWAPTSIEDSTPIFGPGGLWYLVRADNACGPGTVGTDTFGGRTLPASPCD